MQVKDALTGVGPHVANEPPSSLDPGPNLASSRHEVGEQGGVVWSELGDRSDVAFWDDQGVGGGRRVDVVERQHRVGFDHDVGGDITSSDPTEKAVSHVG